MKKRILAAVFAVALLGGCFLLSSCSDRTTYINVYNWGEYISDGSDDSMDVNAAFTEATGIKVNYSYYTSNEDLYAKLKGGGSSYDVIFPSDYMAERMIEEGMLAKLDYANLPNAGNIDPQYRGLYFDPDDAYTVPYNVGMVGLIYNTKLVSETPTSWSVLWDEQYKDKILMFNNPRDTFAIAQSVLGFDYNMTEKDKWDECFRLLEKQKPLVQGYVMDEVFMKMESGEAAFAPYYAGDFLTMQENNPDLEMVFPDEGVNIFVDVLCIPKSCGNKAGAEAYINFLLGEEAALANAEYICYASPNKAVLENEDYSLKDDEYTYPSEEVKANTQYFHNMDEDTLKYMNDLWDQLKVGGYNSTAIYISLAFLVAAAALIIWLKRKRKKNRQKLYL